MAVHLVDHPLVQDTLLILRNERTDAAVFRRMATRISVLLAVEALRDLPTVPSTVNTPMGEAEGRRIGADVVVVPVLRSGLGMLDAVLELLPIRARRPHRAPARRSRPRWPPSTTRSCRRASGTATS